MCEQNDVITVKYSFLRTSLSLTDHQVCVSSLQDFVDILKVCNAVQSYLKKKNLRSCDIGEVVLIKIDHKLHFVVFHVF